MLKLNTGAIRSEALRLKRFRDSMQVTVGNLLREQIEQFAGMSKAPDGSEWKPLTPAYAKRKQKIVGNRSPNKRLTGGFLKSVKYRNGIIAPDSAHIPQGEGLEKKRVSFQVAPNTVSIIEARWLKNYNATT